MYTITVGGPINLKGNSYVKFKRDFYFKPTSHAGGRVRMLEGRVWDRESGGKSLILNLLSTSYPMLLSNFMVFNFFLIC